MSTGLNRKRAISYNRPSKDQPYRSWKGHGVLSNPVGVTAGNIRPSTNKDYTNTVFQKFGLPRPMKWQYRKGNTTAQKMVTIVDPNEPSQYIQVNQQSQSSKSSSLIGQLIDRPGQFSVKENTIIPVDGCIDTTHCNGVSLVADYYPNNTYITNNPTEEVSSKALCCNQEKKALTLVRGATTNLSKKYYTTHTQYMQSRCQTYKQRAFNFKGQVSQLVDDVAVQNGHITEEDASSIKPGMPQTLTNTYFANCYPNTSDSINSQYILTRQLIELSKNAGYLTVNDVSRLYSDKIDTLSGYYQFLSSGIEGDKAAAERMFHNFTSNPYSGVPATGPSTTRGCKNVVYKPSNPQFATEGGVSSSTRLLKLTVDTLNKSIATQRNFKNSTLLNPNGQPSIPFIYKNKHDTGCNYKQSCLKSEEFQRYKALSKLGHI